MVGKQLHCTRCGTRQPFALTGTCGCGGTLLVEYDLEEIRRRIHPRDLVSRTANMWRYRELLPLGDPRFIVSLGEGWTPLVRLHKQEKKLPLQQLWVKREEQNPTGSFKARGFSVAVSLAHENGVRKIAVNSNGNAASALAAYAARAGMEAYVFVPRDCPKLIVRECIDYNAHTYEVDGLIHDAGAIVREGEKQGHWYGVGTLKEPGRAEGKKTMGLELAEQFSWNLPDVIIYPTGGGSGIIGMWKAFRELKELGWLKGPLPRLVSVQEKGCHPIVEAMRNRTPFKAQKGGVSVLPTGMRVPDPPDGGLIVSMLRESDGTAVAVDSAEIREAQKTMGSFGISSSPEGAAVWAGLLRLCDEKWIRPEDRVVLFNTSHAMKYWPWKMQGNPPVVRNYADFRSAAGDSG